MKNILVACIVTLYVYGGVYAQGEPDAKDGWVVLASGDTVNGLVKLYLDPKSDDKDYLQVITDGNDQVKSYEPADVKVFTYGEDKYYGVHIPDADQDTIYTFGKVLVEGHITYYKTRLVVGGGKPQNAFLCRVSGQPGYAPGGTVSMIAQLIKDDEELYKEVSVTKYKNTEEERIEIIKRYNERKTANK